MEISSKDQIVNYFVNGVKKKLLIGVENEKFLFQEKNNFRANYLDIKKVLEIFKKKYQWNEVKENENIIVLKIGGIIDLDRKEIFSSKPTHFHE